MASAKTTNPLTDSYTMFCPLTTLLVHSTPDQHSFLPILVESGETSVHGQRRIRHKVLVWELRRLLGFRRGTVDPWEGWKGWRGDATVNHG